MLVNISLKKKKKEEKKWKGSDYAFRGLYLCTSNTFSELLVLNLIHFFTTNTADIKNKKEGEIQENNGR